MSSPSDSNNKKILLEEPPPVLHWQSWPLVDQKLKSFFFLLGSILLALLVWKTSASLLLGSIVLALLLLTLWRLYLPIVFEWNDDGITETTFGISRFIAWNDIKNHRISEHGVLFLPNRVSFPLDMMRGLYVPWPENKERALLLLDYYRQTEPLPDDEEDEDEATPSEPTE